jgi:hypothetical protein
MRGDDRRRRMALEHRPAEDGEKQRSGYDEQTVSVHVVPFFMST